VGVRSTFYKKHRPISFPAYGPAGIVLMCGSSQLAIITAIGYCHYYIHVIKVFAIAVYGTLNILRGIKVKVIHLIQRPLVKEPSPQRGSGMVHVVEGFQFCLRNHAFTHKWNEPYLPLPSLVSKQCPRPLRVSR